MLTRGNTKLGPDVWCWSLQPITTCPGSSPACRKLCYATKGFFNYPSIREKYRANQELADARTFPLAMSREITNKKIALVRIHVAGDFYSPQYVDKWIEIAKNCEQTIFYAYTRSWQMPDIHERLVAFSKLYNVRLWLSYDKTMPKPPRLRSARVCYMSQNDADMPKQHIDLIFRSSVTSPIKRYPNDNLVCPVEQGVDRQMKMTCTKCKICFEPSERLKAYVADKNKLLPILVDSNNATVTAVRRSYSLAAA